MSAESCASLRRLPSLGRCGRQAGDVEADATDERGGVGFGCGLEAGGGELGGDEAVDGILGPGGVGDCREGCLLRSDE
jgi:hypothetical protein